MKHMYQYFLNRTFTIYIFPIKTLNSLINANLIVMTIDGGNGVDEGDAHHGQ